jgi:hypothetical protein
MSLRERRTRKDLSEDTAIEIAQLCAFLAHDTCFILIVLDWEIRKAEAGRDWSSPTAIQVR